MNKSKLLVAFCCSLSVFSAQATLLTADFRNESDFFTSSGPLVYQSLARSVGAGDEISGTSLLQNPSFFTGGVVYVDFNPTSMLLTLKSRDTGDFDTFDAYVSGASFSGVGEQFSGLSLVSGKLTTTGAPTLSFTGDSLHIQYSVNDGFNFSGGTAVFQVATTVNALPPVPEPETWAMLLGGMGLLTARLRRGKARQKG